MEGVVVGGNVVFGWTGKTGAVSLVFGWTVVVTGRTGAVSFCTSTFCVATCSGCCCDVPGLLLSSPLRTVSPERLIFR